MSAIRQITPFIIKDTEGQNKSSFNVEKGYLNMKKYKICKHIGNLSQRNNGWRKELNFISWDEREPVYDIRTWNMEHTEYGKGVTITARQLAVLKELLNKI